MIYNFYHVTDVHYFSKRNFRCDWRTFPQPSTQICILKSEEAFKKALEIIENDKDTGTVIYSKYYKRYSARVKVRQIKEADFKKRKYQAMTKRDECTNGVITPEEFTEWMEDCFPNRKKKD